MAVKYCSETLRACLISVYGCEVLSAELHCALDLKVLNTSVETLVSTKQLFDWWFGVFIVYL